MGDVVELETGTEQEADGPHLTGNAVCGACQHEWVAVAPVGNLQLECPNCKRWWGTFKHAVTPPEFVWACNCGERLFWFTPEGAMCRRCGLVSSDWAE